MNNTQRRNTNVMVTPQPEGVQEFKVITSGFAAKYGRFAGGLVSVVTRSGGTRVRSPLCEFLRNNDFDARNFFDATKSKLILNQYGATVTGPVVLPKLDYVGVLSPTLVLNVRYGIVSGIFPEERVTCGDRAFSGRRKPAPGKFE